MLTTPCVCYRIFRRRIIIFINKRLTGIESNRVSRYTYTKYSIIVSGRSSGGGIIFQSLATIMWGLAFFSEFGQTFWIIFVPALNHTSLNYCFSFANHDQPTNVILLSLFLLLHRRSCYYIILGWQVVKIRRQLFPVNGEMLTAGPHLQGGFVWLLVLMCTEKTGGGSLDCHIVSGDR